MNVKLLTEQHLEFLSLKGCCTGSSESTLVKIPHCWKSRVAAHMSIVNIGRQVNEEAREFDQEMPQSHTVDKPMAT